MGKFEKWKETSAQNDMKTILTHTSNERNEKKKNNLIYFSQ